jgi:hypothetical protein
MLNTQAAADASIWGVDTKLPETRADGHPIVHGVWINGDVLWHRGNQQIVMELLNELKWALQIAENLPAVATVWPPHGILLTKLLTTPN